MRSGGTNPRRIAYAARATITDVLPEPAAAITWTRLSNVTTAARLLVGQRLLLDGVEERPPDGQLIGPDPVVGSCDDEPKVLGKEGQQIPSLRTILHLLGQLLDSRGGRRLGRQPRTQSLMRDPPTGRNRIGQTLAPRPSSTPGTAANDGSALATSSASRWGTAPLGA